MVARPTAAELELSENKSLKKPRHGQLANFIAQLMGGDPDVEITLAADAATLTRFLSRLDTQGEASADVLKNIVFTNLPDGSFFMFVPENAARIVTLDHGASGAGELILNANEDFA